MRCAYWMGILRTAWLMATIAAVTATKSRTMPAAFSQPWELAAVAPTLPPKVMSTKEVSAPGMSARMPTVIRTDVPLPMPRWVICSPSQSMTIAPEVRRQTPRQTKSVLLCITTMVPVKLPRPSAWPTCCGLQKAPRSSADWTTAMRMVR